MKINNNEIKKIELVLSKQAHEIEPSKDLFSKIRKNIYEEEYSNKMKHNLFGLKRGKKFAAAIVTGCLLLGSITVLGMTMGKSWISRGGIQYFTFPTESKILNDVGFVPKYTSSLPNGFEYTAGGHGESELIDESGSTVSPFVTFSYKNEDKKSPLTLTVTQTEDHLSDEKNTTLAGQLNGINLYYYEQMYKFVPAEYELTEEDQQAQLNGTLEISFGTPEISIETVQGLSWYDSGLEYMLMGNDYNFTTQQMIDMAETIISVK